MDAKLLSSEGNSYLEDIESLVTWNGFTNLYDGYSVFWDIESSALDYSNRRLDFSQWNQFWTNRADSEDTNGSVMPPLAWQRPVWRNSTTKLSLPDMTPSAFELDAALFNSGPLSLPKARDGLVPGVNAQGLPPFPRGISASPSRPAETVNSTTPSEDSSSPAVDSNRAALTQPAGIGLP
jgi:hypothetical protein